MGIRSYDHTRITGLSNSGVTDASGTWNEDVNIGSFVSVPAGATGVVLVIEHNGGSNRYIGLRTPGKTQTQFLADVGAQTGIMQVCPLGPNNTIDIYVRDAAVTYIWIVGVTDSRWQFVDADNPVLVTGMTSAFTTKTISSAPDGTVGVLLSSTTGNTIGWRATGLSNSVAGGIGRCVAKLNGSKQVDLRESASSDISVRAYISGGVNFDANYPPATDTCTADGTWRTSTIVHAGKSMANIKRSAISEDTINTSTRRNGSSYAPLSSTNSTFYEWMWVPLSSPAGEFQYRMESGATDTVIYDFAWFDDFQSGVPQTIRPVTMLRTNRATVAGTGTVT